MQRLATQVRDPRMQPGVFTYATAYPKSQYVLLAVSFVTLLADTFVFTNAIWVLGWSGRSGVAAPYGAWRSALTLNAIDAGRLSWIRTVGQAV